MAFPNLEPSKTIVLFMMNFFGRKGCQKLSALSRSLFLYWLRSPLSASQPVQKIKLGLHSASKVRSFCRFQIFYRAARILDRPNKGLWSDLFCHCHHRRGPLKGSRSNCSWNKALRSSMPCFLRSCRVIECHDGLLLFFKHIFSLHRFDKIRIPEIKTDSWLFYAYNKIGSFI